MSRVAVVTGASAGLGREMALAFATQGWPVAIGARRTDRLDDVAAEIRARGGPAYAAPLDVTDVDSVATFFDSVETELGSPDLVVLNAGIGVPGSIDQQEPAELEAVFATNVLGASLCAREAIPRFRALDRQCDLVFMSSDTVERPVPNMVSYGASKAAVEYLADGLRVECVDDDVRITVVRLGPSVSEFGASFDTERATEMLQAWNRQGITIHKGLLEGADVAEVVLHAVTAPAHIEFRLLAVGPAPSNRSET